MQFSLLSIYILAVVSTAQAGWAVSYLCSTPDGRGQIAAMRVAYSNALDGCTGPSAFEASSGITNPTLLFHEFCGDNGFCANVELGVFSAAGLHISLDGIDVALGTASDSIDCWSSRDAICGNMLGMTGPYKYCQANNWANVAPTHCH